MKVVKKVFLLIGLLSFTSTAFGYFEGSFYCEINNTTISVSLQKKYKFTCQSYIKSFEKSLRVTYKDILNINTIISRGQDLDYRGSVKAKKMKEFDTQQTMYVRLKTSVKNFENNLLEKFKKFFADSTVSYRTDLKKKQTAYTGRQDSYVLSYLSLVNQQLINIDGLIHAKDLKEIFDNSKKYFYIKTKLDEAWDRYFMKG